MNEILNELWEKYPDLQTCEADIVLAFQLISKCFRDKGKILICGNGGSASDSEHIVGELMKSFKSKRFLPEEFREKVINRFPEDSAYILNHLQGALPAISLTSNSALNTAFSNDVASDMIFAQQVLGYGTPGDVLLALSTSGNSINVIRALQVSRAKGLINVGLTGLGGGKMNELCDVLIRVPRISTPDVQELHLPVYHALCLMLEQEFFENLI
jgi:D-sedoheptulose 7-phosphate isomerase